MQVKPADLFSQSESQSHELGEIEYRHADKVTVYLLRISLSAVKIKFTERAARE